MENGFVLQQEAQTIQDILNYVEQQLPGTLQALNNAIGDETTRATNKENELSGAIGGLIPKSEKGRANGVASLNAGGQVPNEQLQWSMRGALNPSDIDSTSLVAGIYQVNGKVIGPAILNGEGANGIFLQYPWGSRVQVLLVGRASDAPAGEQVELYVRRYLPTPQRWTAWMTTADFAKKSDIPESDFYVVEFEDRGGSVTTKQSISDIFAARDSGKQIIGTLGGRSPVYFYFMGGDAPDECPLISLKKILNGIAYYDGYDIHLNGTITRFNYQVGVNASNFIQKSSTAGLVKNDGTIDQTTYATGSQLAQLSDTVDALDNDVDNIEVVIPSAASAQNQLADKDFVNHSVATNTANFIGTFASVAELEAYSGTLTNNDYAFVIVTDAQGNEYYDRYKYNANTTPPTWLFEYRIESTAFTAAQWAAIQSGITSALVTKLQGLENYDDTAIRNAIALIEQNVADNTAALEKKLNAFDFDVAFSEKVVKNAANYLPTPTKLGYWGTNSANKHVAIATTPGEKFLLVSTYKSLNGRNIYAFLTSEYNGAIPDTPMPLVEGTDVGILGDFDSVVVTIPDGCSYLVVTKIYNNNSLTDIYRYRSEHLSDYAKITTAQAEEDNVSLNENELKNVVIPIVIPNGYTFGAFQNVSVTNATDGGTGYADVIIQSFSSTNGVFNVALRNIGASAARVKLSVSVLLYK